MFEFESKKYFLIAHVLQQLIENIKYDILLVKKKNGK